MLKIIFKLFILFGSYLIVQSQDCLLTVPNDPLNTGLFKPWFLSTNIISQSNCSQLIDGSEVFVEATIFDIDNNKFFVYNPLVLDINTEPAIFPDITSLPLNNIVIIHIGINGNTITFLPTIKDNISSLDSGNCINGLPNDSVFGQFAYCNGVNFFQIVNKHINTGLLTIPPILNSKLGDICPTIRSFTIVDQDQSDNVLSQYIITEDLKVVQDTPFNRNCLKVLKIISNGSDNRLLSNFINPAIGCKSLTASNLINNNIKQSSVALNEIEANLLPLTQDVALIPSFDPMVLNNQGMQSITKVNLYRDGVNQPHILELTNNDNINYCNLMGNLTPPFLIKHQFELLNVNSPAKNIGNNLLNFQSLTGTISPIIAIIDPITGITISNNLLQQTTSTIIPSTSSGQISVYTTDATITFTSSTYIRTVNFSKNTTLFCGSKSNNVNCSETCLSGLDYECITPGFQCYNIENNFISCNIFNFCGNTFDSLKCGEPCPLGLNFECKTFGDTCFKDTNKVCNSVLKSTTTSIQLGTTTNSQPITNSSVNNITNSQPITNSSSANITTNSQPIINSSINTSKMYTHVIFTIIIILVLSLFV